VNMQEIISQERRTLAEGGAKGFRAAAVLGVIGIAASLAFAAASEHGWDRFFQAYLVGYAFLLSLSLGALFFVMIQHVTKAGWSVVVRRLGEVLSMNIPLLAVLFLPILLGIHLDWHHLYHWVHPDPEDAVLAHKAPYLNTTFFTIRWVVYFLVWGFYARYFYRNSVAQDSSSDPSLSLKMHRMSTHGLIAYALTQSFAAFDLLMSLDPHWFSTMFGVYFFSGSVVIIYAVLAIAMHRLQANGYVTRVVTVEHYHDVGKMLFGFVVFWAYITFSQYMLIWYANLPEETGWIHRRQSGDWTTWALIVLFGHFVIPFFALISRHAKRNKNFLAFMAAWMVVMHWVDIYWIAMPEFNEGAFSLHPIDFALPIGMIGVFAAVAIKRLGSTSMVPEKDPRLDESMAFENV